MADGIYIGGNGHFDAPSTGKNNAVELEENGRMTPTNDNKGQGGGISVVFGGKDHFGESSFGWDLSAAFGGVLAKDWDGMQYYKPVELGDMGFLGESTNADEAPNGASEDNSTFSSVQIQFRPALTVDIANGVELYAGGLFSYRKFIDGKAPINVLEGGEYKPTDGTTPLTYGVYGGGQLGVLIGSGKIQGMPFVSLEKGMIKATDNKSRDEPLDGASHVAGGVELRGYFGLSNEDKDSDNDGLTNQIEKQIGSDPHNPDTDGDSLLDGEEVGPDWNNPKDTDFDGMEDWDDTDDDNDGILTRTEKEDSDGLGNYDVDNDGKKNWHDTDSDSDGIEDGDERNDVDPANGVPDYLEKIDPYSIDSDGDTITDGDEMDQAGLMGDDDIDNDGNPQWLDPDDDGDTIPTKQEIADSGVVNDDVNGNGRPNWYDPEADGDGIGDGDERYDTAPANGIADYLEVADSDGDGLTDDLENQIGSNPFDPDSDHDTLTDKEEYDDHLEMQGSRNFTPAENGSTSDVDGDGLPNWLDTNTDGDTLGDQEEGRTKNAFGVPEYMHIGPSRVRVTERNLEVDEKIHFEVDKADLKPESHGILNDVAAVLLEHTEILLLEVGGHTDSSGSDDYNLKLSERRAKAAMDYLISQGVEANRLVSKGYGEANPIAPNKTSAGREKNRRTEFTILQQ